MWLSGTGAPGILARTVHLQERDARKSLASMRAARLLASILATAAALNPGATTRRQLAGIAGGGLALVAAPPARADVLEIPPATTKMGGLLEKYADVNRGFRLLKPTTWNQFDGEPGAYAVSYTHLTLPTTPYV